jgi:hypothetical protein
LYVEEIREEFRMSKIRMPRWAGALSLSLLMLGTWACAPSGDGGDEAARAQAWTEIEQAHQALQQKRQELADLRAPIEKGVEGIELPEGSEQTAEQALADLQSKAAALEGEITSAADELMGRVVTFINEAEVVAGEAPSGTVLEAIRLKSSEDLLIAMEHIEKGGDYKKAEDIITRTLEVDPDNPELQEKLAWVREMRFMTPERFAAVEKGMIEAEVRAVLGPANPNNVREFDGGVIAWFYPRGANTTVDGAAGVYFRPERGVLKVYEANLDAIKPAAEGAGQ